MSILQIIILAVVQGLAELLPVSSSAHVIVAEKFMHLNPSSPEMTLLLVMLHTGTMFAVILYFWSAWYRSFFATRQTFKRQIMRLVVATALTAAVGYPLIKGIEIGAEKLHYVTRDADGHPQKAEIELLFNNLGLVSVALAAAGILILIAGLREHTISRKYEVTMREASWMGAVQGLCLPFRGFSRSGATISTGLLLGSLKPRVEEFSFALAVIITPAAIGREVLRVLKAPHAPGQLTDVATSGLLGMIFAFLAGLIALQWLSRWLEKGRWYIFGIYCLVAAVAVFILYSTGF